MKFFTPSEIIEYILNDLDIKAPTFASEINVNYTRIHDIQRGRTKKISGEVANKIIRKYSQYNFSWLISGEGEIYNGTLTERLDKYRIYKNIELNEFLSSINMHSFRYQLIMPSNIRKEEQNAIIERYPDLNLDWLIEGKGEMLKAVPSNLNNSFVGDGNKNINFGHGLKNVHFGHEPETTQAIQSDKDVVSALEKKILFLEGELKSRDKEIEGIKNALTDKERLVQVLMNNLTDKNL